MDSNIQTNNDLSRQTINITMIVLIIFAILSTLISYFSGNIYNKIMTDAGFSKQDIITSLSTTSKIVILLNIIMDSICYPLVIFCGIKLLKIKVINLTQTQYISTPTTIYSIILILGAQSIGSILSGIITSISNQLGYQLFTINVEFSTDFSYNILFFILSCILAPIFEEFLFRGVILSGISKYGTALGVIVSSALFGLFHGNIPQAVAAFIMGIALSLVAIKTKSIVLCVIMHFFANFNAFIISYISVDAPSISLIYYYLFYILFITLSILILIFQNKSFGITNLFNSKSYENARFLFTSIPFWFVIIIYFYKIVTTIKKI